MDSSHRQFLKALVLLCTAPIFLGSKVARALERNKKGFEARTLKDALFAIDAGTVAESKSILLRVPDIAADGDRVDVLVSSKIPNTEMISLLVHSNHQPLAMSVAVSGGGEPTFSTVLRLRKTSLVTAVVRAGGKASKVAREVKVTREDPHVGH